MIVRNGPKKYLAAPVIWFVDFFLLATLVKGIVERDPSAALGGAGPLGTLIYWVVVTPISLGLLYLSIFVLTLRMDFYPDRVRARKTLFFKTLYVAEMTRIYWGSYHTSTGYAGSRATTASRLRIMGQRRAAFLDTSLTNFDEAMKVVDVWVRTRPELVRETDAERTFIGRGVLDPIEPDGDVLPEENQG